MSVDVGLKSFKAVSMQSMLLTEDFDTVQIKVSWSKKMFYTFFWEWIGIKIAYKGSETK